MTEAGEGNREAHIGVKYVGTEELTPNPYNPRRLFDDVPMGALRTSIDKVGILVPLTVYRSAAQQTYIILDGQRRWICAQKLGLPKVPVNQVAEPTVVQNIVTMFQIHKLREDWELMPTALTMQILMDELKERSTKALVAHTGLNPTLIDRCKILLTFDKKYQGMMLLVEREDRVRADFFIELNALLIDRNIKRMSWFKKEPFIQRMLFKYQNKKGLKSVTDFRTIKQHVTNAAKAARLALMSQRLRAFVEEDELRLEDLGSVSASNHAEVVRLEKAVGQMLTKLRDLEATRFYGEKSLWDQLQRLKDQIDILLVAAGRRTEKPR